MGFDLVKIYLEKKIKDYSVKVGSEYFSDIDRMAYSNRLDEVKELYDFILNRKGRYFYDD